jgi:hypothetical protein
MREKNGLQISRQITVPVVMGVSGLFDYYSGGIPRTGAGLSLDWVVLALGQLEPPAVRSISNRQSLRLPRYRPCLCRPGSCRTLCRCFKTHPGSVGALVTFLLVLRPLATLSLPVHHPAGDLSIFQQTGSGQMGRPFKYGNSGRWLRDAEARKRCLTKMNATLFYFQMKKRPRICRIGKFIVARR